MLVQRGSILQGEWTRPCRLLSRH